MKMVNINKPMIMFLAGLVVLFNIMLVSATSGDITFSLNQTDYYFKIGENAIIPLNIQNTYEKQINGMLTYSYTQEINQGGMYISSSNSRSVSFSIEDGNSTQLLNFGTSDKPSDLNIDLKFVYTLNNETRVVNLNGIKIHFVSDDSQKQNQVNQISSSSEKWTASQQSQSQDPFSQMQQQINQIMNNYQQPQNPQQALQNNQMAQDSSAIKKQIENQIKEQQEMKKEFQKQLTQNEEFQKAHEKLLKEGYNLTSANFKPVTNRTGDFEINYKNQNGEKASLKGSMKDGKIESLQKDTPQIRQEMLNQLQNNKQFQEYQKQLQNEGFTQQDIDIYKEQNKTKVKVSYKNKNNETANITAEIENKNVKNVELQKTEKEKKNNYLWFLLVIIIILVSTLGYFIYKKLNKKHSLETPVVTKKIVKKPFDYKLESMKLIEKSIKLFEQKRYKDAYGMASQAVRLFLSYKNGLNKEITNDEIINFLRKQNKEYKEVKECLDLCSLVEFAKYEPNKKDFDKIVKIAKKIIEKN